MRDVGAGRSDDRLILSVADTGRGVPQDLRAELFEPFVTARPDGTGLGLALVQKIVVFHNGRITAAASPLGGASLQITLPLQGGQTSLK